MAANIFRVVSDIGCVKVFDENYSVFYGNGIGNGLFKVKIYEEKLKFESESWEYIGLLEVTRYAYLSDYDCENNKVYEFKAGRYGVFREKDGTVIFERWGICYEFV